MDFGGCFCNSEIDQLNVSIEGKKDIFWADVSVNDPKLFPGSITASVRIIQSFTHLHCDADRIFQRHKPAELVVAVPTSSMSAFRRLSPLVDRVVCPNVSRLPVFAVADAYKVWRDLNDAEVIGLLEDIRSRSGKGE